MLRPSYALLALTLSTLSCAPPATTAATTPPAEPPAALPIPTAVDGLCPEGMPQSTRCGTITVPEDRSHPEGRTIDLQFAVVPAGNEAARADDPVFLLAGGPGQAATTLAPVIGSLMEDVHEHRDLVFVDQRGTGGSNPLQCVADDLGEMVRGPWHPDALAALPECRDGFEADLTQYATPMAMDDLEDVRRALGYDHINLWGGSYGTRAALVYLRRHGEHVRSATLWGVAPPDYAFPAGFGPYAQASFDRLMADCAKDAGCHALLPDGAATLDRVLDRLAANPVTVEVTDPRLGALAKVELTRQIWTEGMRIMLYDAGWSAQIPAMLATADTGDYAPAAGFFMPVMAYIRSSLYMGMFFSVTCAADATALTDADEATADTTFVGRGFVAGVRAACEIWPGAVLGADHRTPVQSDVPVLLMAGELDPVTPPPTAVQAAKKLSNSRVVVFPNTSHLASNANGCERDLLTQFIETADPVGLDAGCTESVTRPPFQLPKG